MVIRKQSEMINLLNGFFNQIIVAIIVCKTKQQERLHGISLTIAQRGYIMNGGIEAVNTPF
jgi:hypothetical protein